MSYYLLNAMEKDRMVTDECTLKYSSVFMVIFSMSYFSARLGSAEKKIQIDNKFFNKIAEAKRRKIGIQIFFFVNKCNKKVLEIS